MGLVFDEQLTLGREYALLGDYSTALVYFQALLQSIQKHASTKDGEPGLRAKWHSVCKEVCEEIDLVKKLDAEKRAFMSPTPVGIDRARRDSAAAPALPAAYSSPVPQEPSGGMFFVPYSRGDATGSPAPGVGEEDPDVWAP
eukprot:CAMPEP_0114265120 /NCGR_PEP_ID=MMETSP0058-20121206/23691_1 /TAXON_ID=36894 /ORGANISM="Pyramimonas parkeae, CCMP726" /LENGTH=141 /DNA_ID=CAMNT_0001382081 /DNA_START=77 /DNA_END=499 /DNA_ORIENTATION=-